jgi:hypothetical protein
MKRTYQIQDVIDFMYHMIETEIEIPNDETGKMPQCVRDYIEISINALETVQAFGTEEVVLM